MRATPRPWAAEHEYISATQEALIFQGTRSRPNGEIIAACHPSIPRLLTPEHNRANAEMIVHRVNSHDTLVDILRDVKTRLEEFAEGHCPKAVAAWEDTYERIAAMILKEEAEAAEA